MTKPGSTETRVREAILRRWRREPESTQEREWDSDLVCGWVMLDGEGGVRWNVYEAIQRAGRRWAKVGWIELSADIEATYERGVFRVRKREQAAAKSGFVEGWTKVIEALPVGSTRRTEPDREVATEPRVTQRQLDMMRVATGGALHDTRNFYVTGPENRDWCELVEMGLAERGYVNERGGLASTTFSVTEAGFRMAYGDVRKPRNGSKR